MHRICGPVHLRCWSLAEHQLYHSIGSSNELSTITAMRFCNSTMPGTATKVSISRCDSPKAHISAKVSSRLSSSLPQLPRSTEYLLSTEASSRIFCHYSPISHTEIGYGRCTSHGHGVAGKNARDGCDVIVRVSGPALFLTPSSALLAKSAAISTSALSCPIGSNHPSSLPPPSYRLSTRVQDKTANNAMCEDTNEDYAVEQELIPELLAALTAVTEQPCSSRNTHAPKQPTQ